MHIPISQSITLVGSLKSYFETIPIHNMTVIGLLDLILLDFGKA